MLINQNYKVESDTLNVTVYHRKDGKKTWRAAAYFSNSSNALQWLVKNEVQGTGMADFQTVCAKFEELTRLINTLKGMPELLQPAPRSAKDNSGGNGRVEAVKAS
jgi:hypothetical protein